MAPRVLKPQLITENLGIETIRFSESKLENATVEQNILNVYNNKPNPFKDNTTLVFETSSPGEVQFDFFDLSGRRMYSKTKFFDAGQNELIITAENLHNHSGVVLYTISTSSHRVTRKLSLVK